MSYLTLALGVVLLSLGASLDRVALARRRLSALKRRMPERPLLVRTSYKGTHLPYGAAAIPAGPRPS